MNKPPAQAPASGSVVLLEQVIPDHIFLYVTRGAITCYDGHETHTLAAGDYCLVRKNRLAKYYSREAGFENLFFCFDESFLRAFQAKYHLAKNAFTQTVTLVAVRSTPLLPAFIASLQPYLDAAGKLSAAFEEVKQEELLLILLQNQPELAGLFFDYAKPEKINLEEFMHRNYRFNVSIEQFAYSTGRSLSAFKRDFRAIFHAAPSSWLVKRRLEEAFVLLKQHRKSSDIYLELGFEDLSHFSRAFKKQFGLRPREVAQSDQLS